MIETTRFGKLPTAKIIFTEDNVGKPFLTIEFKDGRHLQGTPGHIFGHHRYVIELISHSDLKRFVCAHAKQCPAPVIVSEFAELAEQYQISFKRLPSQFTRLLGFLKRGSSQSIKRFLGSDKPTLVFRVVESFGVNSMPIFVKQPVVTSKNF